MGQPELPPELLSGLPPIPPLDEPPDWARLAIRECGEPLAALLSGEQGVFTRSLYREMGIPDAPEGILVREGVRQRLYRAAQSLPPRLGLMVFDGYRPLAVQRYLYQNYYRQLAAAFPELTPAELELRVLQFVAHPSPDPLCPPPHLTGGAVDVYLIVRETGEALPMGTAPDETSPHSVTRRYEEDPEEPFTSHRRLLFHAMTGAGFTNYRGEWWHYDWGNQRWANCSGAPYAIYGVI